MHVKKVKYKGRTGYVVRGTEKCIPSKYYEGIAGKILDVIAPIEANTWGCAQNYDGAVLSAGIIHHVLFYPKSPEHYGPLGRLLGWIGGQDGAPDEDLDTLTTLMLKCTSYEQAKVLFSYEEVVRTTFRVFSRENTRRTQAMFADRELGISQSKELMRTPEQEIIGALYFCTKVNAPSVAKRALAKARGFNEELARLLGKSTYGNLADKPGRKTTSRYDKTRESIIASGHWDEALVRKVLPDDL